MNLYEHKDSNIRKTWIVFSVFLVFIIGLGWVIAQALQNPLILYIAVIFSVTMSLISYWNSDKVALAISGAREVKKSDAPELYRIVENLAITAGLPVPRVYVISDSAMNAFATGRDPKHAVVAVTTGLLERLEKPELEGVIAHELAHIGNRDVLLSTAVVVLVGFVSLLSDFFMRSMWFGAGRRNNREGGGAIMLIGIALAIASPLIALLIQLAISRKREFLADASGALLTRYPEGLASALEKIQKDGTQLRRANSATAHLYIANPFKGKEAIRGLHKLFSTHPPVAERVAALRGIRV